MISKRIALFIALIVLSISCIGCGSPSFEAVILRKASKEGWSKNKQEIALAYAYNYFLDHKNSDKEKDQDLLEDTGNVGVSTLPAIRYNLLGLDRFVSRLDQWLDDFDILLGYSSPENVKYIEAFGLRLSLIHDEKVLRAVRARVKAVDLDNKFKVMTGQVPAEFADYLNGYNAKTIFGAKDPVSPLESFRFEVGQINEARTSQMLRVVENCRLQVSRKFDHKIRDPNNLKDKNAYIWSESDQDLELSNYKILGEDEDLPENNSGNYIEGFRWNNGRKESRPCLKVFTVNDKSVVVIDTKREGDPGFGLPDFVEKVNNIISADNLIRSKKFLDRLFEDQKEHRRIPPKKTQIHSEIVRTESPVNIWEHAKNKEGFTVPFFYRNSVSSNYNIRIELSNPNITNREVSFFTTIKYIKKEWTTGKRFEPSIGRVIEHYLPKPPYDKMDILSARVLADEDTKKIMIVARSESSTETEVLGPGPSSFIEDDPVEIIYTYGEKRYMIKRSPGSSVFDRKKSISSKTEKTGVYEDED